MPSFPILDWSVVRFIPKQAVAPEEPPMERPPVMKKSPVPTSLSVPPELRCVSTARLNDG